MKIGFFGDSFSSEKISLTHYGYKTYISLLEKEYKTKISVESRGGCSHWDIIIKQFLPNIDNLPDVCIFTWPDENRLFHRTVRHIRLNEALKFSEEKWKPLKISYDFGLYNKIWKASEMYYKHLFDLEKNLLEYISSLHYFDHEILQKIKNKKFIHMWSFDEKYKWKTGEVIETPLTSIAIDFIPKYLENENKLLATNNLPGKELNNYVFEQLKTLIEK